MLPLICFTTKFPFNTSVSVSVSSDGVFNYTISGSAKIKDYVGNAKLIVKDMLPYTININKSKLPSTCTYDGNKTITCIKEYNNITEEDYINSVFEVNASFNVYPNISLGLVV